MSLEIIRYRNLWRSDRYAHVTALAVGYRRKVVPLMPPAQNRIFRLRNLWAGVKIEMPNGPYETLLTTEELAVRLGVSKDTVERMAKAGKLPKPLRSKPPGGGKGRTIVRWDLWKVGRFLDGTDVE